ncbi:class A beta-lactamase-related serine hydrolase [Actinomadura logoneensis]|uniref:Class A beta-lactamase-related serine hydrolase n=1 Tax=Actinomadura logoneensis TaxID=2293572 RepID=A0A372JI94_9ACTN|nr:serine hydrolase domain-containing protein [Actinomadura logoneensis]RFU39752.1 class A beta-lactamase-related serine hydrolase [Actinomadura logoneensis]
MPDRSPPRGSDLAMHWLRPRNAALVRTCGSTPSIRIRRGRLHVSTSSDAYRRSMRGAGLEHGPAHHRVRNRRPVKVGDVQKAMEDLVKTGHVVGAIGAVYVDGRLVGKGSAGSRLLDGKGGAIPSTTRYRIGSQTKTMTATVVLQLVNEGRLSLDDKLSKVLPEVADKDLVERADEITVRNLIQLTSGIPDYIGPDASDLTRDYRPTDLLAASRKHPGPPRSGPSTTPTSTTSCPG